MRIEDLKVTHHGRTIDGAFYRPDGKGTFPVVIMSHGYNGHKTDFDITAKYFATQGIGALCYTFCGGSTRDTSGFPTTEMTLFTEKEDLCALIDEVRTWEKVDRIFLFGGSQGGMVSALTAEEREADVDGLILLYPALGIADNWNERFKNPEDIPDEETLWDMTLGRRFFEAIRDFQVKEQVGKYKGKVLILHGADDDVATLEYSIWASRQYPDAKLEIFQREGHGFSEDGNRRMEAMTLYFLHECMNS